MFLPRLRVIVRKVVLTLSSFHLIYHQDLCARLCVNVTSALDTPAVSPSDKKMSDSKSGTGASLATAPTRSDPTLDPPRLQVDSFAADQDVVNQSNWQCPASPTILSPLPLDLIYELWHTYVSDEEESGIVPSLDSSFDGDIFGVGKRPVQREIEKDGCIQLIFVKE